MLTPSERRLIAEARAAVTRLNRRMKELRAVLQASRGR